MEARILIPSAGIFLTVACAGLGVIVLARSYALNRVRGRLNAVVLTGDGAALEGPQAAILRDVQLSTLPFLNRILQKARWAKSLERLLVQADIPLRLGSFVALVLLMGSVGFFLAASVGHQPLFALPACLVAGSLPILWARNKKHRRITTFERLFPDALDMLVSALRAGLAFTTAAQVVADESPDPVAREFAILAEENRLGLDLKDALRNMGERVESAELHLFVTAVALQRVTGGNLSEVLENTAAVIRDRFRILGDVRSLTAHARISGFVLTLLPPAMAVTIFVIAPDYLREFVTDPVGRYLIVTAVSLQVIGFLIMRRIINIKV
jgi:tight adherence protein B